MHVSLTGLLLSIALLISISIVYTVDFSYHAHYWHHNRANGVVVHVDDTSSSYLLFQTLLLYSLSHLGFISAGHYEELERSKNQDLSLNYEGR